MSEEQFLEQYVFYGLHNLNHGIDSEAIKHFSYQDFETVMDRVENHCIVMPGIECWTRKRLKATKYMENYSGIVNWHRQAVAELRRSAAIPCLFAATYLVPEIFLLGGTELLA